jgi:hypothetical protein
MKLAPDPKTRSAIRFWLDCLQVATVVGGVITAIVTFKTYKNEQDARATASEQRAQELAQHAKDTLAATKRELEAPYEDKKLALYLDAARVLA